MCEQRITRIEVRVGATRRDSLASTATLLRVGD